MRLLAALLVLALPALAPAQVITSTWNGASGNWTDPALWAPAVPNNGAPPGATYDAVVSGAGMITLDAPVAVQKLDFAAGTITGGSSLTLNDKFTWSGGTLAGAGATAANGGAALQGGTKNLIRPLTLGGTSDWTAGTLATVLGGSLTVAPAALLRVGVVEPGDPPPAAYSLIGNAPLANAGTLRRADAGGETTVAVPFTNSGTVQAWEGTLALAGGGSSTGPFDLGTRAALRFRSDYALNAGSSLGTNSGTVAFSGGAVTVGVPYSPRVTMMNGGSATFTTSARTHDLYLDSAALAVNAPFTLTGAGTWVGGALAVNAGGSLTTGDGSLFDAVGPRNITGTGTITNHGTFRRSGGGTTTISPALTNFGTLDVTEGTLQLAGGGTSWGTVTVGGASGALRVSNGYTIADGRVSGTTVAFSGGTVNVGGTYDVSQTTVNGANVHFNRPVVLRDVVQSQGAVAFNAPATVVTSYAWVAGALAVNAGGSLTTGGGSLLDAVGPRNITGAGSITNNGTFRRSGGATTTVVPSFTSFGSVDVQEGTLTLAGGGTNWGTVTIGGAAALRIVNSYTLADGRVGGAGTVAFSGGTVNVAGTYDVSQTTVNGAIVNFNRPVVLGSVVQSQGVVTFNAPATVVTSYTQVGGFVTANAAVTNAAAPGGGAFWTVGQALVSPAEHFVMAGTGSFTNAGHVRKTGFAEWNVAVPFTNTGAVVIEDRGNSINLQRATTSTGTFAIGQDGILRFEPTGGAEAVLSGGSITGQGQVQFTGGTTQVNTTYDVARTLFLNGRGNFNVPTTLRETIVLSGTFAGSGPVTVTGPFSWAGGTVGGTGPITVTGSAALLGVGTPVRTVAGPLTFAGTATWDLNLLRLAAGGTLTVAPGGQFTTSTGGGLIGPDSGPGGTLVNNGTLIVPGNNVFLSFGQGLSFVNGGVVQFTGNRGLAFHAQTLADLRPGSSVAGPVDSSGIVRGGGQVTGQLRLVNAGPGNLAATVAPGDAVSGPSRIGTLTFGSATFQGGTAWAMDLGSANPRTGAGPVDINTNDRLSVAGNLTFDYNASALNVLFNVDGAGLSFQHGQTYDWFLASFGAINSFAASQVTITPSNFSGGGTFALQTSGNSLVLSFTAAPEPSTLLLCGAAAAGWLWRRRNSLALGESKL